MEKPDWKIREEEASVVCHSPAVNGIEKWMCYHCGVKWEEPQDTEYDRTQDRSGWPVFCNECSEELRRKVMGDNARLQ